MEPELIGIPWYKKEHYPRILAIFTDGHNLPDTFDDWLKKAQDIADRIESRGSTVIKVDIDPETFPAWCMSRGLNIDSNARNYFVNCFLAGEYSD